MFSTKKLDIVRLGQIYYLAQDLEKPNPTNLLNQIKPPKKANQFLYIFNSISSLEKYFGALTSKQKYILQILTPSHLVFRMHSSKFKSVFEVILPSQKDSLAGFEKSFVATSANPNHQLPAINSDQVLNYFPDLEIQEQIDFNNNFLESPVIDITTPEQIKLTKPGEISITELQALFPNYKIQKEYYTLAKPEQTIYTNTSFTDLRAEPVTLISTKESQPKPDNNKQILNLGSTAHPKSVFKNLMPNLWQVRDQISKQPVVLLPPSWKKSKYQEIFNFTFSRYFKIS